MKEIYLHGVLGQEFGKCFKLDVRSAAEAVRALEANFPGRFFNAIKEGTYQIQRNLLDPGLREEELRLNTGSNQIHIVPVIQGAKGGKGKGIVSAVLGVALIAAAIYFAPAAAAGAGNLFGANLGAQAFSVFGSSISFGQVALWGAGLALSGVSSLLTPTPQLNQSNYTNRERPEERPSYLFNGAVNTTEQGGPVPILYGRMKVGSQVINGGLDAERLPI